MTCGSLTAPGGDHASAVASAGVIAQIVGRQTHRLGGRHVQRRGSVNFGQVHSPAHVHNGSMDCGEVVQAAPVVAVLWVGPLVVWTVVRLSKLLQ